MTSASQADSAGSIPSPAHLSAQVTGLGDPRRSGLRKVLDPDLTLKVPASPGCAAATALVTICRGSALPVPEAVAVLGIGRSHAYEAVRSGKWPTRVIRVGRCIRIPAAQVMRLLGAEGVPGSR
jgi:excisionase family DNA binding protein